MELSLRLSDLGRACRIGLERLVAGNIHERSAWAPELLARFDFWADEAGLFAGEKQSLDHQVRNNLKVRAMLQQFLEAIRADVETYRGPALGQEPLHHASIRPVSNYDEDDGNLPSNNDIYLQTTDTIARLIRLLRHMRKHVKDKLDFEGDRYDPKDQNQNPIAMEFYQHIQWKLDKHPLWKIESDLIRGRLQETMLLRWRRMYFYSTRARAKTILPPKMVLQSSEAAEPLTAMITETEEPETDPLQLVEDEGQTESSHPVSLLSERLTVGPSFKPEGESASIGFSKRTRSLTGVKAVDFPKAPAMRTELSSFMCPLCGTSQPAAEREHKAWQLHVLRDLSPYICLYDDCRSPSTLYHTSKEWFAHMEAMHHDNVWICQICRCEFPNEGVYKEHISSTSTHDAVTNLSDEQIAVLVKMNGVPKKFHSCFFCTLAEDEVDDIRMHMAEHLRHFALASIPWHVLTLEDGDGDSQTAVAGAISMDDDDSISRMDQYIDDVSLSFADDTEMSNLPSASDAGCRLMNLPEQNEADRKSRILSWVSIVREEFSPNASALMTSIIDRVVASKSQLSGYTPEAAERNLLYNPLDHSPSTELRPAKREPVFSYRARSLLSERLHSANVARDSNQQEAASAASAAASAFKEGSPLDPASPQASAFDQPQTIAPSDAFFDYSDRRGKKREGMEDTKVPDNASTQPGTFTLINWLSNRGLTLDS